MNTACPHKNIIITNTWKQISIVFFNYPHMFVNDHVCPSDVTKPGSVGTAVWVLCKTGLKERVYNGIRPCYLVDSLRLCSAVAQMLAVCIWETVGIFFFFFWRCFWLPSALKSSLNSCSTVRSHFPGSECTFVSLTVSLPYFSSYNCEFMSGK